MDFTPLGRATDDQPGPDSFFGELHGLVGLTDFLLADASYEAGKRLPEHSHEEAFFCLFVKGTYEERHGSNVVTYKPFTAAFHPPGKSHSVEVGSSAGYIFSVEVRESLLNRLREYAPIPQASTDLRGGEMVWLMSRLFREYKEMRGCSPLTVEGLVLEMLALVASGQAAEKGPPPWLSRVVDLLHSRFRKNLTLNDVAAEANVHPIHLSRVFRKFHGQAVGDYVHGLRVQFATRQLCRAEITLAEIALQAGFSDQSHFTRVFKQLTGRTPGEFRAIFSA